MSFLESNLYLPSTFNIGPFTVAFYALCILTGIIVGMYFVIREGKKIGVSSDDIYFMAVITIPIAIICARIWYVLFNLSSFNNFFEVLGFKDGQFIGLSGLAIQGGLIGAVITLIIICRKKQISFYKVFDIVAPGILIAQAFGRWGNFFNHELYGPIMKHPDIIKWLPILADNMYIDGAWRHPVFLYESTLCLLGAALMMVGRRKFKFIKSGDLIGAYLVWYGLVRILTESLRLNSGVSEPLMLGPIPVSIAISILFIVLGIAYLIAKRFYGPQDYYIVDEEKERSENVGAVLFDLDGTLLDTKELITKSFVYTFEKFRPGYILSDSEVDSFFGPTLKETFSKYSEDEAEIAEMISYYREFNKEKHDEYVKAFPGAKETLKTLKRKGYDIAVVSSKKAEMVSHGLEFTGLLEYVDVIIGEEETKNPKPSPDGINMALEQLISARNEEIKNNFEINKKEGEEFDSSLLITKEKYKAIYVGDNLNDILAAKAANVKSCGVLYIKDPSVMLVAAPDSVIERLPEIIKVVGE